MPNDEVILTDSMHFCWNRINTNYIVGYNGENDKRDEQESQKIQILGYHSADVDNTSKEILHDKVQRANQMIGKFICNRRQDN